MRSLARSNMLLCKYHCGLQDAEQGGHGRDPGPASSVRPSSHMGIEKNSHISCASSQSFITRPSGLTTNIRRTGGLLFLVLLIVRPDGQLKHPFNFILHTLHGQSDFKHPRTYLATEKRFRDRCVRRRSFCNCTRFQNHRSCAMISVHSSDYKFLLLLETEWHSLCKNFNRLILRPSIH